MTGDALEATIGAGAMLEKVANLRVRGKSPVGSFLRMNDWIWRRLPRALAAFGPVDSYGRFLHSLARLHARREMYLGTFFFRNRPELELIRRLSVAVAARRPVKIAVLGCSNGAEVYSIRWALRSVQPAGRVVIHAVDVSAAALECARQGAYSTGVSDLVHEPVCAFMTRGEVAEMFDKDGERLAIKPSMREGIAWHLGDAADAGMRDALGPQDIVVANRFLCHMGPADAERCLRGIARLVAPGGHLFVSGIDLDVRTKVAKDLGWMPARELLEDIHEGDRSLRADWPCKYWGLEPLDKRRPDWAIRYASAFQIGWPR
ncbi:MAG: CheR family methyltransferase [Myxococcales bacterium]